MSAVALSVLYPLVRPYCKRVTNPGMDQALLDTARDLCLRTKFRRFSITKDILANTRYYSLSGGNADEEVVLIEAAQYNNAYGQQHPLTPIQQEQAIDQMNMSPRIPQAFWLEPSSQIALYPIPDIAVTQGLFVRGVLQPTITATTLDSMLVQQCDRSIAHGALARLLRRNDEPWTNYTEADKQEAKYEIGIGKAMTDVGTGWQSFNLTNAVYRY